MPHQRVCKGCFQNLMPIRRVCKGCLGKKHTSNVFSGGGFFPNHPFARCFWEAFFQTTLSRVVFGKLFSKSPLRALFLGVFFSKSPFRALFLGGFSSKTAFPCAWKCCFRWVVARFGCEKRQGSPRLILLVWSFSKLRVSAFQPCSALSHSHH